MALYLTGLLIDCAALLAVGGYFLYHVVMKKELEDPILHFWIVLLSIGLSVILSIYYICINDLNTASILAWVMAIPVMITTLFILLIILFNADWR